MTYSAIVSAFSPLCYNPPPMFFTYPSFRNTLVWSGLFLCGALFGAEMEFSHSCSAAMLAHGVVDEDFRYVSAKMGENAALVQAQARFLALRTIGKTVSPPRQEAAKENILQGGSTRARSLVYAHALGRAVQARIDESIPENAYNGAALRAQLFSGKPGNGVVFVVRQKREFHAATLDRLSTSSDLKDLPRLAVADETDSIDPNSRTLLTSIRYCRTDFCDGGIKLSAEGPSYEVHLFGGDFHGSTLKKLADTLRPIYNQRTVERITFHVHTDATYTAAPFGDYASLDTCSLIGGTQVEDLRKALELLFSRNPKKKIEVRFVSSAT